MKSNAEPADRIALAARVARDLTVFHQIAYAQLTPDLRIVQVSENFGQLFFKPGKEDYNKPLQELFWEFVGAEDALSEVLAGEAPYYQLERINRPDQDGKIHYYHYRVVPLIEDQPGAGLLLIVEDSTVSGQLEQNLVQDKNDLRLVQAELARTNRELHRLNRLKSLFLSMAAHDMRAPLTAIMGYTDLVRADLPPDSDPILAEFLGIIAGQVRWLSRLLKDLLDLDQIEQGKLMLDIKTCDLGELVREIAGLLMEKAVRQSLILEIETPAKPVVIQADPERIRQILYNLINNAIKYTPDGGRVDVETWEREEAVIIRVQDTGRGMSEEEKAQLFQIYYRTAEARRSEISGTGLGLFIVHTMVEAHHGSIEVETQPGQGTTFTVRLPFMPERPVGRGD